MITTKKYNDFSIFSYEQKSNFDFMFNQLLDFKKMGGDLSLPVSVGASINEQQLISLGKFIEDNIKDHADFNKKLMKSGIIPGLCDLKFDKENLSIEEKEGYGIDWMIQNYDEYEEVILESINNLLEKLPENYKDVNVYKQYRRYDKVCSEVANYELDNSEHPLVYFAEQLKKPKIYSMIFQKYPEINKEWEKDYRYRYKGSGDKIPRFLQSIDGIYADIRNPEIGVVFFKNNIGVDYFLEDKEENRDKLHALIKYAAYAEDLDFLRMVLPKINLNNMEKNKYDYDLSLSKSKNKEVINLLLENGASYKHKIKRNSDEYEVNLIFSRESINEVLMDCIFSKYPDEALSVKNNSDDFYKNLEYQNFKITKLLVEKYQFPIEDYDMLYIAKKQYKEDSPINTYEWVIKNGADVRRCDQFCAKIVSDREEGLKVLRGLNKQGLIVAKSPDMIYEIFQANPTKNFINYYDKLGASDLEKYNCEGYPAWWGANNPESLRWMLNRIDNVEQNSTNGKNYVFRLAELENKKSKFSATNMIQEYVDKCKKKNEKYSIDLSYVDNQGNNILHLLFTTKKYMKENINTTFVDCIKKNTTSNFYSGLNEKNKSGMTPLDILISTENQNWNTMYILSDIINNHKDMVPWKENDYLEKITEIFKSNKEMTVKIYAIGLEAQLDNREHVKSKKIKL